jgi:sulfite reductase (NADPH) flavoprotein alpha-component
MSGHGIHTVKSVCPYCGVGCGLQLQVEENRVVKVSGDKAHPANFGRLCTKGLTCTEVLQAPDRLNTAYVRQERSQSLSPLNTDVAIALTAQKLRAIIDRHGPDAVAFYVSGQMSLEAQYLANKLCKGFIGSNNIDSNSRLCMASAASGYKQSLGADGPPGSYQDIDHSQCFLVIGSNMADCHPVLFLRLLDRCRKSGAKLIVVDPRRTNTADKADLFLPIKPGTDLALLNGLLYLLVKDERINPDFIAAYTEGWDELLPFLDEFPPEKVAAIAGIPETTIRQAAQWIGEAPEWMTLWTMGLNQSTHGTWHTNAICNLHLATGKICRLGSGPFSLTGQPNAMGGREVGYLSHGLPGQRTVLSEADRRFIEELWQVPSGTIKAKPGLDAVSLFRKLADGEVKAVWIICTNPVASMPHRQQVIDGLHRAELVITQEAFLETETNRYADIVLPAALWAEAEGVMVNSERNLTLMEQAVPPPGQALADWQLIARVAQAMGYDDGFSYQTASEVFAEIRQTWNSQTGYDLRGASYERLHQEPLQWPCPPEAPARNPIRYRPGDEGQLQLRFTTPSGRARFFARPYLPPAELPDADYPFLLNTGRLPHQWHTLTKTSKVATLNKLNPAPFIEIHPDDAAPLGIADGDKVFVRSRRGYAMYPVTVTPRVQPGNCFAPFHWNDLFGEHLTINAVTNDAVDPTSLQPELKSCAVQLQKARTEDKRSTAHVTSSSAVVSTPLVPLPEVRALRALLGLAASSSYQFGGEESLYLNGFLSGVELRQTNGGQGVPVLPDHAPLPLPQRVWLNGLLAGLFSRAGTGVAQLHVQPQSSPSSTQVVTILFASQTGNAESVANHLARRLVEADLTVKQCCMADYPTANLEVERFLFIVTSTYGDGETPNDARALWNFLNSPARPALQKLRYAVLALGDSNYERFCQCGKDFDAQLSALGAQALTPRADCDVDFQIPATRWIETVTEALTREIAGEGQSAAGVGMVAPSSVPVPTRECFYSKTNPFPARLLTNRCLNGKGSTKETRHCELSLADSGLHYEAGDALGIWPTNCPTLVDEILSCLALQGETVVNVAGVGERLLKEALLAHYEIVAVSHDLVQAIAERSRDSALLGLVADSKNGELKRFLWGRQFVDLLHLYPRVRFTAVELLAFLRKLQPRFYSIASSPLAHPGEAHLTVRVVRYDCAGRTRKGTASTFLAERVGKNLVSVFVRKSPTFHLPADLDTPIIMIGPGTGVAPFRGFLHDRHRRGARGKNWLFFGEQHAATDFYYRDELAAFQHAGVLTRLDVAFSRDQQEKVYVQHRLLERGAEVWAWLQDGASVYVCGDASRMAKDVDTALRQVVRQHGGRSEDNARMYLQQLTAEKRYLRDVY